MSNEVKAPELSGETSHQPLVSVITITFNAVKELTRTVESVGAQTFRNFEHIVIDGESSDGTREYLQERSATVRWISEADDGIADALNKAVAIAKGQWLIVLHADDTFASTASLETAATVLRNASEDIVSYDVLFTNPHSDRRLRSQGLSRRLLLKTSIPHQGAFINRKLHEKIGVYNTTLKIAMDYELFARARKLKATTRQVPQVIAHMPDTGVSSRLDWKSLNARFAEERRVQTMHFNNLGLRLFYAVYWPVYLLYRRAICAPQT